VTNPTSARRAAAADLQDTMPARERRRVLARVLPAGALLIACLLLATAAAVDGRAAAMVLALWVGVLVCLGIRLSEPVAAKARAASRARVSLRLRAARRPVLVLAELDELGELGASRTLPIVASDAAIAVLDARPRG
jgi:hypothetical protein